MYMLVGVLVEVMTVISSTEKEGMTVPIGCSEWDLRHTGNATRGCLLESQLPQKSPSSYPPESNPHNPVALAKLQWLLHCKVPLGHNLANNHAAA